MNKSPDCVTCNNLPKRPGYNTCAMHTKCTVKGCNGSIKMKGNTLKCARHNTENVSKPEYAILDHINKRFPQGTTGLEISHNVSITRTT